MKTDRWTIPGIAAILICLCCCMTASAAYCDGRWSLTMSPDKAVYHPGDTISYYLEGYGPVDHAGSGVITLDPKIRDITFWTDRNFGVTCNGAGNQVSCTESGGTGWGEHGNPGVHVTGTVTGGPELTSSATFGGFDDNGGPIAGCASSTVPVKTENPVPEFPTPVLPVVFLIGFLGLVIRFRQKRSGK